MQVRRTFALWGATVALVLVPSAVVRAAGTSVSVRVEGKTRTLLAATVVHTRAGSITKGGTPPGACPATSAAGALDVATHHRWNGSYGTYGLSVTSILGETHPIAPPRYYWSIWVNNRYAPAGVCGLKLHRGEQLLFAAVSDKGSPYPIVITGPRHATAGHPFALKASYDNAKGVAKPLSGVRITGASEVTSRRGTVMITAPRAGALKLTASRRGYIRAETTVRVAR